MPSRAQSRGSGGQSQLLLRMTWAQIFLEMLNTGVFMADPSTEWMESHIASSIYKAPVCTWCWAISFFSFAFLYNISYHSFTSPNSSQILHSHPVSCSFCSLKTKQKQNENQNKTKKKKPIKTKKYQNEAKSSHPKTPWNPFCVSHEHLGIGPAL